MRIEEWKDINGYEGLYQVSSYGRIKSLKRTVLHPQSKTITYPEKIKSTTFSNGYELVTLCKDGKCKTLSVHRIVAMAFIINIENKPQVNHIDKIRSNNNIENLEWCTQSENIQHSISGYRGKHSKLTESDIIKIRHIKENEKLTNIQIGNIFNVSKYVIQKIITRKNWHHV